MHAEDGFLAQLNATCCGRRGLVLKHTLRPIVYRSDNRQLAIKNAVCSVAPGATQGSS